MTVEHAFSIRAKLIAFVMATTLVALSLAGGALALFEIRSHRRTLAKELGTMADIVGQNLAAPLILERVDSAELALRSLASQPDVLSACFYDSGGKLFARYIRHGDPSSCPGRPRAEEAGFTSKALILYEPVVISGQAPATLRMVASLGELHRQVRLFALVLLLVLSGSALAALLVSSGLQGLVSKPILALAHTAQQISRDNDYSLRAPQRSDDEVGVAVEAFNRMLDRIQAAVSERKRAEEQLMALNVTLEERVAERTAAAEQKAAELRRSNEELERFASVASHDLQEPLRAVASYTQLLRRRLSNTPDSETDLYLGHVLTAVGRMKVLIHDLLNYARVGAGKLSRKVVECDAALQAALADLAPSISESGAEITHGPLPTVSADPGQMGQLFSNLISNAIRFRGPAPPRIDISAERTGDFWQFAVRDNGIGIEPRHHDRIFVIFQRLHGADRPGTGIGLAICRKIVELHGGRIWVQSEPGAGATFHFTLPALPSPLPGPPGRGRKGL
jgi:signal transduction histidine kinase